jgi:hypothetical protein
VVTKSQVSSDSWAETEAFDRNPAALPNASCARHGIKGLPHREASEFA